VRHPAIEAESVRYFKNKIDQLNQTRTNLVEQLDDYFLEKYKDVSPQENARLNTESPAWAIDRLSILALKIYHMQIEVERMDLSPEQFLSYQQKLELLQTQKMDLMQSIESLLEEIEQGKTQFKVYRQVKMYNDRRPQSQCSGHR
jgi:predicted  nucleic acid-binding Zn-ribbon protein